MSFFEQFTVEQLISTNLPDTLWPIFDYDNEHYLKPSQMCQVHYVQYVGLHIYIDIVRAIVM